MALSPDWLVIRKRIIQSAGRLTAAHGGGYPQVHAVYKWVVHKHLSSLGKPTAGGTSVLKPTEHISIFIYRYSQHSTAMDLLKLIVIPVMVIITVVSSKPTGETPSISCHLARMPPKHILDAQLEDARTTSTQATCVMPKDLGLKLTTPPGPSPSGSLASKALCPW